MKNLRKNILGTQKIKKQTRKKSVNLSENTLKYLLVFSCSYYQKQNTSMQDNIHKHMKHEKKLP